MIYGLMNRVRSFVLIPIAALAISGSALAGPVPRTSHTVHGKVLAVDAITHSLTVQARRVEAWMGSLTTIYHVENAKVLRQVKAGDQIMGKVYDGETALQHVEIVAVSARPETSGTNH